MFLCCIATTFAQFSGSGSGTENDPYLILNPIQLNQLRNFLNQSGVYFKLMANIDLTEFLEDENPNQGWQPVGSSSSAAFKGILNGNGKTIKGLWIKRSSTNNVGFFGYTDGATINDVSIIASTIEGKESVAGVSGYSQGTTINGCSFSGIIKGASNVGGYVGNSGNGITINGCSFSGTAEGASNIGGYVGNSADNVVLTDNTANVDVIGTGNSVGGFIGRNNASNNLSISGCTLNDGIIRGVNNVGGCCGENTGNHNEGNSISNTYIHANISGADNVGGICGLSNCYKTINLNNCGIFGVIIGASNVGGLVGKITTSCNINHVANIKNSFAVGHIFATGDYVGGLIGSDTGNEYYRSRFYYSYTDFVNNYHSGSVTGANYVGGLIGYKKYGEVTNCYAIGSVTGNQYVGGLLGYQESNTSLKRSAAINTRVTATTGDVNRVVGYNGGTIGAMGSTDENKSFNRTIVISQGVAQDIIDSEMNGTGVSATTLKLKATYVAMGWDFTDIWAIQETECYPYFKTQTAPPVILSQVVSGATTVSGKCVDGGTVTLEIDGVKQQKVSTGHEFSFTVSPLQAGHEVRVSAKADGKEHSYYTTEVISFLGKGTEADPYQISTAADLTQVYRKGHYKLMNDIDLTSYINQYFGSEGWESIGREGSETIFFDGNGHKVTGLWCNSTRDNTGLFSCFANGYIKNLTVETAIGKQVKGGANTGILIGKMINGTIENCKVSGKVSDGTPVGGMVGLLDGGSISRCQATVSITTTGATSYVGGLVGEITGGTIDQCFTAGTLNGTGTESYVGGLIGKNYATVTNSYSTAKVSSSYNAAGLVAYNYRMVDKCHATGDLFSNNYAAGVIGYNDGANAVVQNSAAMNNKIDVVYESQQVQQGGGYGQRIIGGIKNGAPAPEMNNYALKTMQVSVNDVPQRVYDDIMNGTAMTNEELMTKGTYSLIGWDLTNIWDIDAGISYPYLRDVVNSGETPDDPDDPIVSEDNALVLEDVTAAPGSQFVLPINMVNVDEVTALQFDLYLPSGVTIAEEDGELLIDLADRTTYRKHSLAFRQQADGAMRITCSSNNNATFSGNEGTIINITLNVSSTIEEKEYVIAAKNIEISTKGGTAYNPADAKAKLSISSYLLGDADQSGKVSINDAVCIVNYILGFPNQTFLEAAADVDLNGHISINDKVVLINDYILGSDASSAKRFALSRGNASTGYLYIDNLNMQAGETRQIEVKMHTDRTDIKALQCDIVLPRGLEFVYEEEDGIRYYADKGGRAARSHSVISSIQGDGSLRVVESNDNNDSFKDNDLPVFTFTIRAVSNMAEGSYSIMLSNVELSYGQSINPDDREVVLIIGNSSISTDINAVDMGNTSYDVYNMNGQMIRKGSDNSNLPRGIYIVNGKKVVVK